MKLHTGFNKIFAFSPHSYRAFVGIDRIMTTNHCIFLFTFDFISFLFLVFCLEGHIPNNVGSPA